MGGIGCLNPVNIPISLSMLFFFCITKPPLNLSEIMPTELFPDLNVGVRLFDVGFAYFAMAKGLILILHRLGAFG